MYIAIFIRMLFIEKSEDVNVFKTREAAKTFITNKLLAAFNKEVAPDDPEWIKKYLSEDRQQKYEIIDNKLQIKREHQNYKSMLEVRLDCMMELANVHIFKKELNF